MARQIPAEKREKTIREAKKGYKTDLKRRRKFVGTEEQFIEDMVVILKFANYSHNQIGAIVGVSRGQVGEMLQKPAVVKRLEAIRAAVPQAAYDLMQGYLIEAVQAVVHVMRTEAKGEVVLKAAAEIFDRVGMPKISRQENINPPSSALEKQAETLLAKFKDKDPEIQEKAAELTEMFEQGLANLLAEEK